MFTVLVGKAENGGDVYLQKTIVERAALDLEKQLNKLNLVGVHTLTVEKDDHLTRLVAVVEIENPKKKGA